MKIGTYYYPEQWPQDQWERDFDHMAGMGMQIVHMAEFAWFTLEPKPGDFRFDWLNRCLDLAAKRKMSVILCTPTAAPPIWLTHDHPDTLALDEHGTPQRFGGRRHYSPISKTLHEAASRIVTAMADRFGDHPSVMGWQIDNEYGCMHDQSAAAHEAFRGWLQRKYETIDKLNAAWGNQFWNAYYTDFSQILFPPSREPAYGNPHHVLDGARFWSWAIAQFNKLQADILRPRVGHRFITTNFMPFHLDVDPADCSPDLTLMSWDSYPVHGRVKNPQDNHYRIADPAAIGFMHDQMSAYHGRWGLMELQPGHVNWSGVPVLPYPGAIHLWIWTALAHGAEFVTTYRFRQPRFGIEMWHDGLLQADGVTPSPGGRQFVQAIEELKRIDVAKWNADHNKLDAKRTIGIVCDFEQLWWLQAVPQSKRWDQPHWLQLWYSAATRLGMNVKILLRGQQWPEDLPIIVAPGLQMVDEHDIAQMKHYVSRGGHLVLTCRTALQDRTGQFFEGKMAHPILDLIGGEIEAYDSLPPETWGHIDMDGKKHPWGVWGDLLYAAQGTKVLAKYADQFYAGAAAVTQSKKEKGVVTYCGVFGEGSFVEALAERLATQAGLETTALPTRVQLIRRGPYRIVLNYLDVSFNAPAPKNARFVIGSRRVDPAGVAIWEE